MFSEKTISTHVREICLPENSLMHNGFIILSKVPFRIHTFHFENFSIYLVRFLRYQFILADQS